MPHKKKPTQVRSLSYEEKKYIERLREVAGSYRRMAEEIEGLICHVEPAAEVEADRCKGHYIGNASNVAHKIAWGNANAGADRLIDAAFAAEKSLLTNP